MLPWRCKTGIRCFTKRDQAQFSFVEISFSNGKSCHRALGKRWHVDIFLSNVTRTINIDYELEISMR